MIETDDSNFMEQFPDEIMKKLPTPEIILEQYFTSEFKKLNINLNNEQIEKSITSIYPIPKANVDLKISDIQLSKSGYLNEDLLNKDISLIFNNNLQEYLQNINNNPIKSDITEEIAKDILNEADAIANENILNIIKNPFHYIKDRKNEELFFIEQHTLKWGYTLDLLDSLISISIGTSENFYKENYEDFIGNNYLNEALIRLSARAFQVSLEILTLLRNGYSSGATARWRTLYEICTISCFLADNGNSEAKKYLDFHIIEALKEARISGDKDEEALLKEEADKLLKEYGSDYKNGDFGWASNSINKKKVYFTDIEKAVDFSNMRFHYKLSCNDIHAGSMSLFYQNGLDENDENSLLAGPSYMGISKPCIFTVYVLNVISTNLMLRDTPSLQYIANCKLYEKIRSEIEENISEIEKTL